MYICWHTSSVGVTGRLRQYRDVRQAGSMLCSRHIGSTFFKTSLYPSHSGQIRTVQRATRVAQIRRKTGNVLRLLVEIFECEEKNPRGAMSPKPISGRTFSRVVFPRTSLFPFKQSFVNLCLTFVLTAPNVLLKQTTVVIVWESNGK